MVITLDFDSSNDGSIPSEASKINKIVKLIVTSFAFGARILEVRILHSPLKTNIIWGISRIGIGALEKTL